MVNIYLLHGFLGLPRDWEFMNEELGDSKLHCINLYDVFEPEKGMDHFSTQLNGIVDKNHHNIFIGYSLGGRLGLHAVLDKPELWKSAAFVSTHPGLSTEAERATRIVKDGIWAMKFLTVEWSTLMEKWNEQPIFAYSKRLDREESDFSRPILADVLTYWSLGQQEDLRERLANLDLPIQWIVGNNDSKFVEFSNSVTLKHPKSRIIQVEGAGHRVPWDQNETFIDLIRAFNH